MSNVKVDDPKAKERIADLYFKAIKSLGYDSKLDGDGDIAFQSSTGLNLVAIIDADHKQFVRIAIPGIYEVAQKSRLEVLESCNYANRLSKGAKVYIPSSARRVWVAYEVILNELEYTALENTIATGVTLVTAAARRFLKNIDEAG